MFHQFGSTAETLSKASTMVFRIGTDAHLYDDPEDVNISPLLDSKFDSEKCEALKRLLALIAQGCDVSNFFPQVVKNVASQSLEVKKLVYLYLLHYAEKRPNEALLSINCFQKDLGDINPLVRACALRTMAGIRLHVVAPLVLVAVKKCSRDSSVYVRKCAATALPKIHDLRLEETVSTIEEIIQILLSDSSPGVVGAAAAAFASVCPNNLFLIGRNYQRLCEVLPDVEEWGQIVLIGILLRYVIARHGLVKESIMCSLNSGDDSHTKEYGSVNNFGSAYDGSDMNGFHTSVSTNMISRSYMEGPDEYLSRSSFMVEIYSKLSDEHFVSSKDHNDVKILLQCTSPLLWSNNSAVVLAAASVHWIMAPRENIKKIVKPLLFLLRSSNAAKYVVLCNIQVFAKAMPSLFAPYFEDLFICCSDSCQVKALKLEILSVIATDATISSIFREFQDYIRDPDRNFAADTVAAIGVCAQECPEMANLCLDRLLALTRYDSLSSGVGYVDGEADVLVQAIKSIKLIVQQDPPRHEKVIIQLIRGLDSIKVPAGRALIIWMVGEYNALGDIIPRMLTIVIKYLASSFMSEALEAKLQILNTTVKVLLCAKGEDLAAFKKVSGYVIELAKSDLNYDLRDRARLMRSLLSCYLDVDVIKEDINGMSKANDLSSELSKFVLVKNVQSASPQPTNFRFYLPGSLSQIVLHAAPGYESLPKPCSLRQVFDSLEGHTNITSDGADNSDSLSGSSDEESASGYSSRHSVGGSSVSSGRGGANDESEGEESNHPLIQVSHGENAHLQNGASQPSSADVREIMSKSALESWLDEQPVLSSLNISDKGQLRGSSARIFIGDISGQVNPKSYQLLDPTHSNGLKIDYTFSSQISNISPLLVCVEISFINCSSETKLEITIVQDELNEASDSKDQTTVGASSSHTSNNDVPTLVAMEEITSLDPNQIIKRILHVRFHHHLLPLKLSVYCHGKKHPIKLRPDIGYFVKPLHMDIESFTNKVSHLPGMFEYMRRSTFIDHIEKLKGNGVDDPQVEDKFLVICKSLALKMLSNANFFLVSVDLPVSTKLDDASGLCLRLSAEILSNSIPCLITLTVEGKCLDPLVVIVKVNCEDTVFCLNLLNRIVSFLAEPSPPGS